MILDITGTEAWLVAPLKLIKQISRVLAQQVDQHIDATPVRHANDGFRNARGAGPLHKFRHAGDEGFTTLKAKPLGAWVLGAEILFQPLGGDEAVENPLAEAVSERRQGAGAFHALLDPGSFRLIGDVHVFSAYGAAVGLFQGLHNFAQLGLLLAEEEVAGLEAGVQVGSGQLMMLQGQQGHLLLGLQAQGVKAGPEVAAPPVAVDQFADGKLLAFMISADAGGRDRHHPGLVLGEQQKVIPDGGVGNVGRIGALNQWQGLEIAAPLVGYAGRVFKVLLVKFLDISSIAG